MGWGETQTPIHAMNLFKRLFLLSLLFLTGCRSAPPVSLSPAAPATAASTPAAAPSPTSASSPAEAPVTLLPLSGPAAARRAEFSGLAWYGDWLILLPQYPQRFAAQAQGADGALFALAKRDLLAALDAGSASPLAPQPIPILWDDLPRKVRGFEGFEALAFQGETVYLSIEASPGGRMKGYLVRGEIAPDLSALRVDAATLTEIPLPADVPNKSVEALLSVPQGMAAFYEVNGAAVNPAPAAWLFSPQMALEAELPFPALEYRLTDVSALDAQGVFWGVNYFYPGDAELRTDADPLAARYGLGESHTTGGPVERLVALRWSGEAVTLLDEAPLYLRLLPDGEARNWEGLVRLEGRGFLLVTDKHPETLLGFVPAP